MYVKIEPLLRVRDIILLNVANIAWIMDTIFCFVIISQITLMSYMENYDGLCIVCIVMCVFIS